MLADRTEPQGTNFDLLKHWLETTTEETFNSDLELANKYLHNMQTLILSAVSYSPLEFAQKIRVKLEAMEALNISSVKELMSKLEEYLEFLEEKTPRAMRIAERYVNAYESVAQARERVIMNLLTAVPKPQRIRDFFTHDPALAGGHSIFELGVSNYQVVWDAIKANLASFEDLTTKYPDNQLALLLEMDDNKFLESVGGGQLALDGEVGMLALQRIISEYDSLSLGNKRLIGNLFKIQELERTIVCDLEALHSELLKLQLYKEYCKSNNLPLVAWIGSARPVFSMIDANPGGGAYLNCDDSKWSPELNRTWLLAVAGMGYEVQLVEQHFPNIEAAIFSGNLSEFVSLLADEIRPYYSEAEKDRKMHSQYHGGVQPTATPQEIMLLMSLGCQAQKNKEGSLILKLPTSKTFEEQNRARSPGQIPVTRKRRHSLGHSSSPQPVKRGLFDHPGKSAELRSEAASPPTEKGNNENKKRQR